MSKATFDYQLSVGHPLKVYCRVCWWASANMTTEARYCPYGHGELAPFSEYSEPVNKIEDISPPVNDSCKPAESADFWLIDPTGVMTEQTCMGCGYRAVLPYRATCPTCRNPYPVGMVLCETWPDFLKGAWVEKRWKERKSPAPTVKPKVEPEGQLSLFGALA